jgi:hypothetical protein
MHGHCCCSKQVYGLLKKMKSSTLISPPMDMEAWVRSVPRLAPNCFISLSLSRPSRMCKHRVVELQACHRCENFNGYVRPQNVWVGASWNENNIWPLKKKKKNSNELRGPWPVPATTKSVPTYIYHSEYP